VTRRQALRHEQADARGQRRTRAYHEGKHRQIESDGLHEFHELLRVQTACCDNSSVCVLCVWLDPCIVPRGERKGIKAMLNYALLFLLVGLIAGALGLFGVASVATQIAWVLFIIGAILLLIHLATGRRTLTP